LNKKVLIVCHDTIGEKMAGPGIRYQHLAQQISKVADVTLGVYTDTRKEKKQNDIIWINSTDDSYKKIFADYDVIFAQWLSGEMLRYLSDSGKIIIIDLYAPVPIEYLASIGFSGKKLSVENDIEFSGILETYRLYLEIGDFFVCSNERQRDFWVGFLTASNHLYPSNFDSKKTLANFALCPMGISNEKPVIKTKRLRKQVGLSDKDFVLLWTGGIWDWFDAKLVIKSMAQLSDPRVKLVFMGTQHPNTKVEEMLESKTARKLAEDLNLLGKSVFFMDGWVSYNSRAEYLLDADMAIYADKDSVETRFSHRTRVLDHIWACLPTICSKGDYLSESIEHFGLGLVVNERTPEAFAKTIQFATNHPESLIKMQNNIKRTQKDFTWENQAKELLQFIKQAPLKKQVVSPAIKRSAQPRRKLSRRVKNSIKVLLGKVDV
jgi:glycosyltransferase involved in cell wall biosynthesis